MRNLNLTLLLTVFLSIISNAQIVVNPHPVAGFQIASNNLLEFDVISASAVKSATVQFIIRVSKDGESTVLIMSSGDHQITQGLNSFNASNLNITNRKYINSELANYEQKMRSFPVGEYTYCIQVICKSNVDICTQLGTREVEQTDCSEFTVLPASPLLLSMPEDEDIIEEQRPNFSWIPPMPIGNDPDISYSFKLVKLNEDQSPEDGIRRNRPIYQEDGIPSITRAYPTTLEDLEKGTKYAWQVEASLGRTVIATSDVWEFEIEQEKISESHMMIRNRNDLQPFYQKMDEAISLTYDLRYLIEQTEDFTFILTSGDQKTTISSSNETGVFKYGKGSISINLDATSFEVGDLVQVELINNKSEKLYASFLIIE